MCMALLNYCVVGGKDKKKLPSGSFNKDQQAPVITPHGLAAGSPALC